MMNQAKSPINYKDTYFQFKELTKIHGEPNYDSIKRLHNEVKANARRILQRQETDKVRFQCPSSINGIPSIFIACRFDTIDSSSTPLHRLSQSTPTLHL